MKSGLSEPDKVRFFELSIKTKTLADAWLSTLTATDKASFKAMRAASMAYETCHSENNGGKASPS